MRRVIVIKLGALGDFVLAFAPFAAIRAHHASAHITLLTTTPFAELAQASPWFDAVEVDDRPALWNIPALLRLRRTLRSVDMVYDLQTSGRSGWYYRLGGRPPWSGIAPGCTHPHANAVRDTMHTVDRQHEQLVMAGIHHFPPPDVDWVAQPLTETLHRPYAMLVPGAAPHRPAKLWPWQRFAALAQTLVTRGQTPVITGSGQDAPLGAAIRAAVPAAVDLTGRTSLRQLAAVAASASVAVGNDTGPMHLAAALGTPCVVLFSSESDPALTAPRGRVTVLSAAHLAGLPVERVAEAVPAAQ